MSSRTDRASEVLGRIMNTHEAALRQPFGPKQYQPETSSDEEADEDEDAADESIMFVMSEDPRTPESLIRISQNSSYNVLDLPTHSPASGSAPIEEDVLPTEQEELEELASENERLKAAIATALHEEKERSRRRSDRAAFKRMERIYASAELQPEPQLPARAVAGHTALAHAGEMGARLKAAGARVGHVTCSLMWSNTDDLDLHCESEIGGHISWLIRKGKCGGHLDVDMNASEHSVTETPVENIVWDVAPPPGIYRIWVENNTARNDGPTPFVVRLTMDGKSQEKEFPDVRKLESVDVFSFQQGQEAAPQCTEAKPQRLLVDDPHEATPTPQLISMLKERERVMQEQKQEIEKLRQQLAMQQQGAPPVTTARTSEYLANIQGMSSAFQSGVAPGGSISELQRTGTTFTVKESPSGEK